MFLKKTKFCLKTNSIDWIVTRHTHAYYVQRQAFLDLPCQTVFFPRSSNLPANFPLRWTFQIYVKHFIWGGWPVFIYCVDWCIMNTYIATFALHTFPSNSPVRPHFSCQFYPYTCLLHVYLGLLHAYYMYIHGIYMLITCLFHLDTLLITCLLHPHIIITSIRMLITCLLDPYTCLSHAYYIHTHAYHMHTHAYHMFFRSIHMLIICLLFLLVVHECKRRLLIDGYSELKERDSWAIAPGGKVKCLLYCFACKSLV